MSSNVRPIVTGAPSDADEVVALRQREACGQPAVVVCTATRLSSRALLTAAHCVADTPLGLLEVVGDADATGEALAVRIAAVWFAPGVGAAAPDLAVVATTAAFVGPAATLGAVPSDAAGASVTIVGYGSDGTGAPGIRRAGTATIDQLDGATVVLAPGPALTCGGDSGGPVLLGGELIAVTSFGDAACAVSTTAVRVDVHRTFIDASMAMAAVEPEGRPAAGEADCGETDGCNAGGDPATSLVAALLLGVLGFARRTRRRTMRRRGTMFTVGVAAAAALFAGCSKRQSGPCPGGRQHGAAPPAGLQQWCTDAAGAKHGAYREWWPSGQRMTEAHYRNDRQHGRFASWRADGKPKEEGELADGLRVGRWREWHEAGGLKREADHGAAGAAVRWTLYREDGGTRWIEGGDRGQRQHGHFVEWYPDGKKTAEGEFTDGTKSGTWSYWNPDGSPSMVELGAFAADAFVGGDPK